ncbi:MAG: hypothetical protein ABIC04_01850 [Nanoarchaeota archaeon]
MNNGPLDEFTNTVGNYLMSVAGVVGPASTPETIRASQQSFRKALSDYKAKHPDYVSESLQKLEKSSDFDWCADPEGVDALCALYTLAEEKIRRQMKDGH